MLGARFGRGEERVSVGATAETSSGLRFLSRVVLRRRVILAAGLVAGLLTGFLAAFSAPNRYAAATTFAIENPAPGRGAADAKAATDQVAELMPTLAQLAVSDDVLSKVTSEAGLKEGVSTLRSRLSTSIPFQSLVIVVRIELDTAAEADAAMASFRTQFEQRVSHVWGTGTFVALPIQQNAATKAGRSFVAVILIATIIGLALALVVSFVLDTV